jgi:dihydroflavonol-4-reductase
MRTAFVTGGTGFVGLNLVAQLREKDWKVVAIHRPGSATARLAAELRQAGLDDPAALAEAMPEGADAVFRVAGNVSWWRMHDERQHRVNVEGTRNVVTAALQRGAKRFIHTSSAASFGLGHPVVDEGTKSTARRRSVNVFPAALK